MQRFILLFLRYSILLFSTLSVPAYAAVEFTSKELNYADANALLIDQFAGRLTISTTSKNGIQIRMTGAKQRIAAVRVRLNSLTLVVNDAPERSANTTIVGNGNSVHVQSSGGGQATVEINGRIIRSGAADMPPLQADVAVNRSIPVTIKRLTGTARLDKGVKLMRIIDSSGDVHLADVQDASLAFNGSGSVTVQHANGDLALTLSGSGSARVEGGFIRHLHATVEGSGDILISAPVEHATLSVNGSGLIEVDKVKQKPRIAVRGAGDILIGNW